MVTLLTKYSFTATFINGKFCFPKGLLLHYKNPGPQVLKSEPGVLI